MMTIDEQLKSIIEQAVAHGIKEGARQDAAHALAAVGVYIPPSEAARLAGVDRRPIHNWAVSGKIRKQGRQVSAGDILWMWK